MEDEISWRSKEQSIYVLFLLCINTAIPNDLLVCSKSLRSSCVTSNELHALS